MHTHIYIYTCIYNIHVYTPARSLPYLHTHILYKTTRISMVSGTRAPRSKMFFFDVFVYGHETGCARKHMN